MNFGNQFRTEEIQFVQANQLLSLNYNLSDFTAILVSLQQISINSMEGRGEEEGQEHRLRHSCIFRLKLQLRF